MSSRSAVVLPQMCNDAIAPVWIIALASLAWWGAAKVSKVLGLIRLPLAVGSAMTITSIPASMLAKAYLIDASKAISVISWTNLESLIVAAIKGLMPHNCPAKVKGPGV